MAGAKALTDMQIIHGIIISDGRLKSLKDYIFFLRKTGHFIKDGKASLEAQLCFERRGHLANFRRELESYVRKVCVI
jgi:hypothetical protein